MILKSTFKMLRMVFHQSEPVYMRSCLFFFCGVVLWDVNDVDNMQFAWDKPKEIKTSSVCRISNKKHDYSQDFQKKECSHAKDWQLVPNQIYAECMKEWENSGNYWSVSSFEAWLFANPRENIAKMVQKEVYTEYHIHWKWAKWISQFDQESEQYFLIDQSKEAFRCCCCLWAMTTIWIMRMDCMLTVQSPFWRCQIHYSREEYQLSMKTFWDGCVVGF